MDVALAISLVETALPSHYDAAVIFTNDTDLLPAIEMAFHRTRPDDRNRSMGREEVPVVP
ncbi:NYN domain-containing protein [Nonomuraea fuscirosea]|uniref:NYN domain-containing protein n=1 Tax=Nonomuraea fuscirosea TaxID=1291556 RepID=UPI000D065FBE|nr:NYN domain-containing protein [Nonomuraea fuscirosea]